METHFYALTTVEGLHLQCDFFVYSAALFGCPPNYLATPVLVHDLFREPYEVYAAMPFSDYGRLAKVALMDNATLVALKNATTKKMNDFTCLAWELDKKTITQYGKNEEDNSSLLSRVVAAGEQILDLIRLFLFRPGEETSIGRVGSLGGGVSGVWIGESAGENGQFIARRTAKFQFVQARMEIGLSDVKKIYNDEVFRELSSVVCSGEIDDPTLSSVIESLRTFRESRDLQSAEARILRLAAIAEHLAQSKHKKRLHGEELRKRVARLAWKSAPEEAECLRIVKDLWDNVRNPLTHSTRNFAAICRDAKLDTAAMEKLVFAIIEATVLDWRLDDTWRNSEVVDDIPL